MKYINLIKNFVMILTYRIKNSCIERVRGMPLDEALVSKRKGKGVDYNGLHFNSMWDFCKAYKLDTDYKKFL